MVRPRGPAATLFTWQAGVTLCATPCLTLAIRRIRPARTLRRSSTHGFQPKKPNAWPLRSAPRGRSMTPGRTPRRRRRAVRERLREARRLRPTWSWPSARSMGRMRQCPPPSWTNRAARSSSTRALFWTPHPARPDDRLRALRSRSCLHPRRRPVGGPARHVRSRRRCRSSARGWPRSRPTYSQSDRRWVCGWVSPRPRSSSLERASG
jgi:hypothetical protein